MSAANEFAADWLAAMWRASWQGGLFIFLAWMLLKLPTGVSARMRAWIWWIACLQLLVRAVIAVPIVVRAPRPVPATETIVSARTSGASSSVVVHRVEAAVQPSIELVLLTVWALVVLGGIVLCVLRLMAARRMIRDASPVECPIVATTLTSLWGNSRRAPRVLQVPNLTSPLLVGWLRSAIVVREGFAESHCPEEIRMVLAHEIAHLRRGDQWLALVPLLTQLLFCFHPFAWLATRENHLAREEACDLEVVRLSGATPGDYARLLLKLAQSSAPVAALGAALGYRTLRRRIMTLRTSSLLNKPRRGFALLSLVALASIPWYVVAKDSPQVKPKKPTPVAAAPRGATPSSSSVTRSQKPSPSKTAARTPRASTSTPVARGGSGGIAQSAAAPKAAIKRTSAQRPGAGVARALSPNDAQSQPKAAVQDVPAGQMTAPTSATAADSRPRGDVMKATNGGENTKAVDSIPAGNGLVAESRGSLEAVVDITFDNMEANKAIKELFKAADINYAFRGEISTEKISCSLKGVTAESALQTILRILDKPTTYRIEGGIVIILPKE